MDNPSQLDGQPESRSQKSRLGEGSVRSRPVSLAKLAVSGGSGFLGQLVLKKLLLLPEVTEVHVFDVQPPVVSQSNKIFFHRMDLTREGADFELARVLAERGISVFIHAALFSDQGKFSSRRREIESIGTFHVLNAVAQSRVERFFAFSSTFVYGAHSSNPNFMRETQPLQARGPAFVRTRVDVEKQILEFSKHYPGVQSVILRFAPILGPAAHGTLARYFLSGAIPKVMGYDPLFQFVHEEDAARAALLALQSSRSGVFNIVGRGVMPLSTGFHMCGRLALPIPPPFVRWTFQLGYTLGVWQIPQEMVPFFQYLCVADGRCAREELGFVAEYSSRQALKSMVEAHRLRQVGFSVPSLGLGEERPESSQRGFERVY